MAIIPENLFHLDIETCGLYKDIDEFKINDERGYLLFERKCKKMGWDQKEEISESYLNQSSIMSTYGKICCISFGYLDLNGSNQIRSLYGDDEFDIVNSFNELLKKIEKKNFSLCGFRIMAFDIPWILHKLHKYDIKPADIILPYDKKPWEMRIVDMSESWKLKFAYSYSFDETAYELDLNSSKINMDGSLVHQYYYSNKIDDIKNYCEDDIRLSIEMSKKLFLK
jgi:predicted PolB exonuclease-like 3'-5' exonuclease